MSAVGTLRFAHPTKSSPQHDHLGADADPTVEVDDVLVGHAEAARRHRLADGFRLVRSMDAIERGAEIHRARTERIGAAALHVARPGGAGGGAVGGGRAGGPAASTPAIRAWPRPW